METENKLDLIMDYLRNLQYDERSLQSIERKGTLERLVKEQLHHGDQQISADGRRHFTIPLEAYFNYGTDYVNLDFQFSCLPNKNDLNFEGIAASLNIKEAKLQYGNNDLPNSQELYQNLKLARSYSLAHSIHTHSSGAQTRSHRL